MSSNVGSFYYDRLEEFLPEKKIVAEKKLMRRATNYFTEDGLKVEESLNHMQP